MSPLCARLALPCFVGLHASAAPPTLEHLYPVAVQAGTTNAVNAIGKFDPWPVKVWVDTAGIAFKPETNNGNFTVAIATNTPIGPHLVRVFHEQGASELRFLIVTREPQLAEREPNDDYSKPQLIERLPASLNGRLEKSGDVDSFAVALQAGQTLIASVEAYTLGSPIDAVLRFVDEHGLQVAWNHDDGRTLDPFLAWTATSAGVYIVQVFGFAYPADSAVRFVGNNKCVYRLQLSRGPYLRHTLPLGVQRATSTSLRLLGWNLGTEEAVTFDGTHLSGESPYATLGRTGCDNTIRLPVGDGPEWMEREPNNVSSASNRFDVPCAITGCIDPAGDEDRFNFMAKKGEQFLLAVQSTSLGFPLDPWLKIENGKGQELAKNDDGGSADSKLEWTAPEDGPFVAAIGNVLHRGGADHFYRLSIDRVSPELRASLSGTALTLEPGKTNDLKITIKRRHGFQSKLSVSAVGLPADLTAAPLDVPEKSGDVTLKLVASPQAAPFSGPIQIIVTEVETRKEHRVTVDLTSSSVNNGVPGGFNQLVIDSTDQLWLTVLPTPTIKTTTGK
jgi:hypothetical protein